MSSDFKTRTLGRTGLEVGRLGLAASYGAPAGAFEEAFEKGCTYFYYGSGRRRAGMRQALRNLCDRGARDKLVVAVQTYARFGLLTEYTVAKTLRSLGIDYADILILGWHNRRPSLGLVDQTMKLREKGLVRFIGLSGHNRKLFPELSKNGVFDLFHIRYNAAHRGAETESFPFLTGDNRPGLVTYTATRWGQLLKPKMMPAGEGPLTAADCYRFVLSNPDVDVCMCGPRDIGEMQMALSALDLGPFDDDKMNRVRRIGDHIHSHSKGFFSMG